MHEPLESCLIAVEDAFNLTEERRCWRGRPIAAPPPLFLGVCEMNEVEPVQAAWRKSSGRETPLCTTHLDGNLDIVEKTFEISNKTDFTKIDEKYFF